MPSQTDKERLSVLETRTDNQEKNIDSILSEIKKIPDHVSKVISEKMEDHKILHWNIETRLCSQEDKHEKLNNRVNIFITKVKTHWKWVAALFAISVSTLSAGIDKLFNG